MTSPETTAGIQSVTVRLFAAARERAASDTVTVQLPAAATIRDLRAALGDNVPSLRPLLSHLFFAVGTDYAGDEVPIPESGEVVAFPPVSGG